MKKEDLSLHLERRIETKKNSKPLAFSQNFNEKLLQKYQTYSGVRNTIKKYIHFFKPWWNSPLQMLGDEREKFYKI